MKKFLFILVAALTCMCCACLNTTSSITNEDDRTQMGSPEDSLLICKVTDSIFAQFSKDNIHNDVVRRDIILAAINYLKPFEGQNLPIIEDIPLRFQYLNGNYKKEWAATFALGVPSSVCHNCDFRIAAVIPESVARKLNDESKYILKNARLIGYINEDFPRILYDDGLDWGCLGVYYPDIYEVNDSTGESIKL